MPSLTQQRTDQLEGRPAHLVAVAGLLLLVAMLPGRGLGHREVAWPYVWQDVAVVSFLAALPLGVFCARFLVGRIPGTACFAGSIVILPGVLWLLALPDSLQTANGNDVSYPLAAVARGTIAALTAVAAAGMVLPWQPTDLRNVPQRAQSAIASEAAWRVLVLVLVPAIYLEARTRHDHHQLSELVDQTRWGEAFHLATTLQRLQPDRNWNGHTIQEVTRKPGKAVSQLEARVAAYQGDAGSPETLIEHAQNLAILGRSAEAIALLTATQLPTDPHTCNLLGMLYETRADWSPARHWYRLANRSCASLPDSPQRSAALGQSLRGEAYCERKLGRLPQAEAAYLKLLEHSPTAEIHFLLAQFYEDTQQAENAHEHALRAMMLEPNHFQTPGRQLINKLRTGHFGCLHVARSRETAARGGQRFMERELSRPRAQRSADLMRPDGSAGNDITGPTEFQRTDRFSDCSKSAIIRDDFSS